MMAAWQIRSGWLPSLGSTPTRWRLSWWTSKTTSCLPGAFGVDPPVNTANAATAHRAKCFAEHARHFGVRTIYTRQILYLERLTSRQRRWEVGSQLCRVGTPGAELFVAPAPGSAVVDKSRFDVWQSRQFIDQLDDWGIDGLVIGGVELQCCVLYAVLGAEERGYHYLVCQGLVSGLDTCDATSNRAVREYLAFVHPCVETYQQLLDQWRQRVSTTGLPEREFS
jgi:nicotinamidase-related amidase